MAQSLAGEPGVTIGGSGKKGFGSSAFQVVGKIFAMVSSKGESIVKLPKPRVDALEASGDGRKFDPGHGRIMKESPAIEPPSELDWVGLAREAIRFVGKR